MLRCLPQVPQRLPPGTKRWHYLDALYRFRWVVLITSFLISAALASYAIGAFDAFAEDGLDNVNANAYKTAEAMQKSFAPPEPEIVVLLESTKYTVDDAAFRAAYERVKAGFQKLPTFGYISWFDYPSQTAMVSDDRHKALFYVKVLQRLTNAEANKAVPTDLGPDIKVVVGGDLIMVNEVEDSVLEDLELAETRSLPFVILLMVLAFRGLVPMLAPMMVAMHTLVWSLALLHGFANHWRVTSYALEVVTMMGLGLSLDYSLFIVGRFMSERKIRPSPEDAVVVMHRVMSTSGRTIQFSAVTVLVSLTGSFVFNEFFVGSLSLAIICVSFCACLICSIVLPALLFCLDHHIYKYSTDWIWVKVGAWWRGGKPQETSKTGEPRGIWYHITHKTMRWPKTILLCAMLFFGALTAVFFTTINFGAVDTNVLPMSSPARIVLLAQEEHFSKMGRGQLDVYLKTSQAKGVLSPAFLTDLHAFTIKAAALPGVSDVFSQVRHVGKGDLTLDDYIKLYSNPAAHNDVTGPLVNPFLITNLDRVSRVRVSLRYQEFSTTSRHTIKALRSMLLDTFSDGQLAEHGVMGDGALFLDTLEDLQKNVWIWAVVMVLGIFTLVLLMTASPFLAVKAVATSMMSLGGAFGIIVMIFQWGVGKVNGLGMVPCGYLDGLQLIFIFTVAFGLGVDYELFVLGSVQEQYHLLGDHREAIAVGLDRAGRYVSMAAILLGVTVGAFVMSGVSLVKMIGFGIAICVVLDATIVRSCVVPTVLILAGEKVVWWSPKWLKAFSDRIGLSEKILTDDDLPVAVKSQELPPKQLASTFVENPLDEVKEAA